MEVKVTILLAYPFFVCTGSGAQERMGRAISRAHPVRRCEKKEAHSIGACGLACQNAVWLPSAEKEKTDSSRWKENHDPRAMSPLYSSFSFCREPNRHCCAVTVVTCRPFRSRATVQRPSVHVTFSYPGRLLRFGKRPRVQSHTHLAPESFVQDIPLDGKVFPQPPSEPLDCSSLPSFAKKSACTPQV